MDLVFSYIERSCTKYKDNIAVKYKDEYLTYRDLLIDVYKIGTNLSKFVINNEPVVVFMDKGIDSLESFFGILYSGGCYCLVNTEFPDERIKQIKETLNLTKVITDEKYFERAVNLFDNCKVFKIDKLKKGNINLELLNKIKKNKIDIDPVYINFTSGSTGIPKGVIVSHKSIIDFITKFTKLFNINDNDVIANQAPFDFDVSVKDIYSSIFVGATLLLIPKEYFSNPTMLLDYLDYNNVTTLIWAVSALCLITTFHGLDYKIPKKVDKIIFSGEIMPLKHLGIWMEKLPNAMFVNVYGPTEITCNCTYHIIDKKRIYLDYIPIGIPFPNEKVFLLNDKNEIITKSNEVGEICVSGSCLSLGYYNNAEQSKNSFIQNPLNNYYAERIYRTGDLAKYNNFNELIFCGRKDFQIKYLGHRIELEEIDRAIMKTNGILRVCTIFDEEKSKIYSFYVGSLNSKDLRTILQKKIPLYMIPTKIIKLDDLPLTKNGKIDRKKLFDLYKGVKA